jgi:hypothetical protein
VIAGAVDRVGADRLDFTYARSYLENEKPISLYAPELPMRRASAMRTILSGVHGMGASTGLRVLMVALWPTHAAVDRAMFRRTQTQD